MDAPSISTRDEPPPYVCHMMIKVQEGAKPRLQVDTSIPTWELENDGRIFPSFIFSIALLTW